MIETWNDADPRLPARSIDRDVGEGPPRCCARRLVAADSLVRYDRLPPDLLAKVRQRFPDLPAGPLYLCDACGETLIREGVLTREERARGFGLSPKMVAKAWLHDEQFLHRGPDSAPAEVRAQPWWPEYQALVATVPRESLPGEVQALFRRHAWSAREERSA